MARKRKNRQIVRLSWYGGFSGVLFWAAGCSSAAVCENCHRPLRAPPGQARSVTQYKSAVPSPETPLRQVQHEEEAPLQPLLPANDKPVQDRYPIDLTTALRLAGANNLQIALAGERVRQAQARLEGA